jgi:hypothetical protein
LHSFSGEELGLEEAVWSECDRFSEDVAPGDHPWDSGLWLVLQLGRAEDPLMDLVCDLEAAGDLESEQLQVLEAVLELQELELLVEPVPLEVDLLLVLTRLAVLEVLAVEQLRQDFQVDVPLPHNNEVGLLDDSLWQDDQDSLGNRRCQLRSSPLGLQALDVWIYLHGYCHCLGHRCHYLGLDRCRFSYLYLVDFLGP